jgi:hypothetical protein
MSASAKSRGLGAAWDDAWLLDGVRTPFADYNGPLAQVSPTDLGIKAARAVLHRQHDAVQRCTPRRRSIWRSSGSGCGGVGQG